MSIWIRLREQEVLNQCFGMELLVIDAIGNEQRNRLSKKLSIT